MPIEIKVAPPGITISQGRSFMVTDEKGEINPYSHQGVYALDTRFIGSYALYVNRQPWKLVNSSQINFYSSRIYLTNPALATGDGDLAENSIGLTVDRYIEEGIHEDLSVANYSGKKIKIGLFLAILCDFITRAHGTGMSSHARPNGQRVAPPGWVEGDDRAFPDAYARFFPS